MTVRLVTFLKSGLPKAFTLKPGSMVIGRKEGTDLRIQMGKISREHCRISLDAHGAVLLDLDSRNGTYVNGKKISEAKLQPGDLIKLGPIVFMVQIDGVPKKISPPASAESTIDEVCVYCATCGYNLTCTPDGSCPECDAAE